MLTKENAIIGDYYSTGDNIVQLFGHNGNFVQYKEYKKPIATIHASKTTEWVHKPKMEAFPIFIKDEI